MNDRRLLACAELCKYDKAVDVGTDHGHLAVYLVQNNISKSVIACDINKKPLESAVKAVAAAGLEDKIKTVLSDGLENIPVQTECDIIIAGMGGEMMADILGSESWVKNRSINLVLQPMTKWDHLRRWLYNNGFEVTREIAVKEGKFVYSVMQACYIGRKPSYPCDTKYLYVGKVKLEPEDDSADYYTVQVRRLHKVAEGIANSHGSVRKGKDYLDTAMDLIHDIQDLIDRIQKNDR